MKRIAALVVAALLALPATAMAQEDSVTLSFPGGWIKMAGTVSVPFECPEGFTCYAPGEEPECPTCPPPIVCPDPEPCPDCPPPPVWECPDGWTCTPPDDPNFLVMSSNRQLTDTLTVGGTFNPGDSLYVWLDVPRAESAVIDSVIFFYDGNREQKEAAWMYALKGANNIPLIPFIVPSSVGIIQIAAVVHPGGYAHTGVVEIVNPSLPPDTVPPVPPDTTPPEPGDTLAFFSVPTPDVTWGPRDSTGAAVISWPVIDGTRIRYSVLVDVSIPDFYLEEDDNTWWNIAGGTTTTRTVSQPPASPMAVCVKTAETAEVGRGPGGYFYVMPPDDLTTIPISDIVCHQYVNLTDNIYAFYASPYHSYYFQPGDTIQDGGYSIGLIKADGGPIVADSVLLLVDSEPHTLLYEPRYGATWNYDGGLLLNYGPITLSYIVFGGELPDSGELPLTIADHNGGSIEWPGSAQLSAPTSLRVERYAGDTTRHVIAWDAIPEDEQCENDGGYPANCPDVYGDEVYYLLSEVDPPLNFTTWTALASTQRSFPWDYPGDGEILPETISFCVTAEAWDCPNCIGTGGVREVPAQDTLHITRYFPVSETTCVTVEGIG